MRTITRDEIIDCWNEMCDLAEEESQKTAEQFMKEQPALGIYLSANMEDQADEESRAIELAITIWSAMKKAAGGSLASVTQEQVEAAEQANVQSLEQLDESAEMGQQDLVRQLVDDYNQRELLGFGVEVMMSGNEEEPDLAPDSIGLDLLLVKTLIDCLDQQAVKE